MKKFNLNYLIKVKLTDHGKDIYYHQYDGLLAEYPKLKFKPHYPEVDENGFSTFQLWMFIELYGPYIGMCKEAVIEDLCFYFEDEDLEEVSCNQK